MFVKAPLLESVASDNRDMTPPPKPTSEMPTAAMDADVTQQEELQYFANYWPSGAASQASTADAAPPQVDIDDRATKSARTQEHHGKRATGLQKGKGHAQGHQRGGRGQGWKRDHQWSSWGNNHKSHDVDSMTKEIDRLRDSLFQLQRLALRQEDFISCIRAELSWVVFLRLASIVTPLLSHRDLGGTRRPETQCH